MNIPDKCVTPTTDPLIRFEERKRVIIFPMPIVNCAIASVLTGAPSQMVLDATTYSSTGKDANITSSSRGAMWGMQSVS